MFDESTNYSLRSKHFRLVSEQRKTEERRGTGDFWFWPHENGTRAKNWNGGGEGEGNPNLNPFFPTRYPFSAPAFTGPIFRVVFDSPVPRSLFQNRAEKLSTQANLLWLPIFTSNCSIISQFTRRQGHLT